MRKIVFFYLIFCFHTAVFYAQETKQYKAATIAFYNLENLFDTENDPLTFDDDRTPEGKDKWTEEKYQDKLKNMAKVIAEIGADFTKNPPAVIGVCEIENKKVLEDLVAQPVLQPFNYGIVHYNSPDKRGIDVALLYQKDIFTPTNSIAHELLIFENESAEDRVFTRDQLVTSGFFDDEKMHFIVNHWPSRSGGEKRSSYKREMAARLNKQIIDSLQQIDPYTKIISMGDFNDDPTNKSLSEILKAGENKENLPIKTLYNPMANMMEKGFGSSAYRDSWNLFDQIIVSAPFLNGNYNGFQFYKAGIFSPNYLITPKGQYKGYPFRSYGYEGYTGGYSDHFPVYIYLIKEVPREVTQNPDTEN